MRTYCILSILLLILGSHVFAYDVVVSPTTACRTRSDDTTYGSTVVPAGDGNNHDSSKLTIRQGDRGEKSWIRFDGLNAYDLASLRGAVLTLTFLAGESAGYDVSVSYVNDDCHDNDIWVDHPNLDDQPNGIYALTWNNAPGNNIASFADLDPTKTTLLIHHTFPVAPVTGQKFDVDILAALQADTDGIVQIALHDANADSNFCTWDHATIEYRPYLTLTFPPLGADWPNPEDGFDKVPTDLAELSWTNPEPNLAAYPISSCDVYFGTEPNRPEMDVVELVLGEDDLESVLLTADNFSPYVPLANNTWYYWVVDCHDPIKGVVEGEMWSFYTNNNEPPYDVSAGADQVTWLDPNALVTLSGTASDDGLPNPPGALTYLWERTAGPTSAVINTPSALSTSVNFTEAGDYTFQLTVSDSQEEVTDTVRVVIGTTPCEASHVFSGDPYNDGDINQDCLVDLADLQELIIDDWLNCTDELTNCL